MKIPVERKITQTDMNGCEDLTVAPPHQQVWLLSGFLAVTLCTLSTMSAHHSCDRRWRVFQGGRSRSKDQVDGTGMSLGSRKGVRLTGKHAPPVDWNSRGGGPCIIHSPAAAPLPPEPPTVISIGPLLPRRPEGAEEPGTDGAAAEDEWTREGSCQSRAPAEMGFPRQTMEELKTILRESPLLSVQGRVEGRPGAPYTYLHGSGGGSRGRTDGRQDDGSSGAVFSTFKPRPEASRRGPGSREGTPIQPSHMDASSSFRADANTNVQPGVRTHTHAGSSSWRETGASHTGPGDTATRRRQRDAFSFLPQSQSVFPTLPPQRARARAWRSLGIRGSSQPWSRSSARSPEKTSPSSASRPPTSTGCPGPRRSPSASST